MGATGERRSVERETASAVVAPVYGLGTHFLGSGAGSRLGWTVGRRCHWPSSFLTTLKKDSSVELNVERNPNAQRKAP